MPFTKLMRGDLWKYRSLPISRYVLKQRSGRENQAFCISTWINPGLVIIGHFHSWYCQMIPLGPGNCWVEVGHLKQPHRLCTAQPQGTTDVDFGANWTLWDCATWQIWEKATSCLVIETWQSLPQNRHLESSITQALVKVQSTALSWPHLLLLYPGASSVWPTRGGMGEQEVPMYKERHWKLVGGTLTADLKAREAQKWGPWAGYRSWAYRP